MHPAHLVSATALLVLLAGCGTSTTSVKTDTSQSLVDSLRSEITRLRDQNRTLRDSLQFYADIESGQYHRDMRSLKSQLARLTYKLRLMRDGGQTISVLSSDSLFAAGVDSIGPRGKRQLVALSRQLQSTYSDRTIWVEAHTDNTPLPDTLAERLPSNWARSSVQATVIVRRLVDLTGLAPSQFMAIGYGSSRPRASNDTRSGRHRNRRIRVAVFPASEMHARSLERSW